ncbi:ciliogenesis-associated TTC17-interacting protein [Protopterus annectens]|uniref:ciliogenesis-associated TTC17-interacting protein n=1 Tax=Protopterus annectens TaxID=7888 RepID=UPI001CFA840B|nr:ciliogenesis-associated TTC17-interacting protein [Protopterus annectens]
MDVVPKASQEAVEFLSSVGPDELQLCVFSDSLVTISDTGCEVGEFMISIQPAWYRELECFLIHANSHGAIDDIPCGTSVMGYVSKKLDTLEQHYHEYLKLKEHPLDRKIHITRQLDKMVVNKIVTEGEDVRKDTFIHSLNQLEGFVSEASNLLISRILAQRQCIPNNMSFLAFDMETNLCTSTYKELGVRTQSIGKQTADVFGIERTVHSEKEIPITWQSYFLSDGHLASRIQVGSTVTMSLLAMPALVEKDEEEQKPVFEKTPLNWEEDIQLYSRYLDRKEELKADHTTYTRHHPELKALLADFLQFLLLRKPEDVTTFAAEYFAPFSSQEEPEQSFRSSETLSVFSETITK